MKPHPAREPMLTLRMFANPNTFASGDRAKWAIIAGWQKEGLIRVVPISKTVATITLTDKSKAVVARALG
jgi:hypothetical protein